MDIKILLQAVNQPWFITPEAAQYHALMLHNIITGQQAGLLEEKPVKEFAFIANAAGKRIGSMQDAVDNGVGVINIRGAIMKYDYCGAPGTQSMMKALQQANDNPAISSILLQIDSPGGSVDGTQQFANAVKNSSKPVVAYINGMMCSAAMWIGSAASERIASSNTDVIGSIGTMASWKDFSGYYEKMGLKSHEVYATDSTHKNVQFREANGNNADGKPNYEPLIKTWLDPLNNEFTSAIQQNLPNADKTVLNGSHFIATDAKKKGLIDKVGTFEQAVKSALQKGKNLQNTKTDNSMKWTKILAFLGIATAATAEDIQLSDSHIDNMEALVTERDTLKAELAAAKTASETATADVTRLTADLTTANSQLSTVNTALATAKTEITRLEGLGAPPATTTKDIDDVTGKAKLKANDFAFQKELNAQI